MLMIHQLEHILDGENNCGIYGALEKEGET
jgi:hypothetical protein